MKKLMLYALPILMLSLTSISCNNDDDSGSSVDKIVGTWKVTDIWVNGDSIYPILVASGECSLQNEYVFGNDHSFTVNTFVEDADTGDCVSGEQQTGTWANAENNYTVTFDGASPQSSEVTFVDENNFTTMMDYEGQSAEIQFTRQ